MGFSPDLISFSWIFLTSPHALGVKLPLLFAISCGNQDRESTDCSPSGERRCHETAHSPLTSPSHAGHDYARAYLRLSAFDHASASRFFVEHLAEAAQNSQLPVSHVVNTLQISVNPLIKCVCASGMLNHAVLYRATIFYLILKAPALVTCLVRPGFKGSVDASGVI